MEASIKQIRRLSLRTRLAGGGLIVLAAVFTAEGSIQFVGVRTLQREGKVASARIMDHVETSLGGRRFLQRRYELNYEFAAPLPDRYRDFQDKTTSVLGTVRTLPEEQKQQLREKMQRRGASPRTTEQMLDGSYPLPDAYQSVRYADSARVSKRTYEQAMASKQINVLYWPNHPQLSLADPGHILLNALTKLGLAFVCGFSGLLILRPPGKRRTR